MAACAPGISVARLALDNGINANMLHKWRRAYLADELGVREFAPSTFVEVHISLVTPVVNPVPPISTSPHRLDVIAPKATLVPRQTVRPGAIEISFATVTLRLEGSVVAVNLAQVLRHFHP